MTKKICLYVIGLMITALGVAFIIRSMVGTGPWDTVAVGLQFKFGLTIGMWTIISQGSLIFLTALIEKSKPRFDSVLVVVVRSWFLDIWFYFVLVHFEFPNSILFNWVIFCIGVIFVGLGIGIYIEAKLAKSPIDDLMIVLSNRFGWTYSTSRIIIEATGASIGFLLSGPVGLGTIFIVLTLGKIIQTSNRMVQLIAVHFTNLSKSRGVDI